MPRSVQPSLVLICPSFADALANQARRLPALERLIAYGGKPLRTSPTRELNTWQNELLLALDLQGVTAYPSAPLTVFGAGGAPEHGTWLHAEPVVQSISAHGLTMSPCTPLSAASLAQIASLVRDHLAASQMFWEVVQGRTYLRCHSSVDARTVAVSQATLGELREAVPTGPSAKILRRAMTELQMLLHEKIPDPLAPNAFWLWGAGEMPQLPSRSLPPIWTNDDYARGIYRAHAANNCYPLPPVLDVILDQASEARRVVVIRDCSPSVLERDWFAPALHALNKGRLHQVDIYLDGWQVLARRSFMRRLFAPSRNLAESMT